MVELLKAVAVYLTRQGKGAPVSPYAVNIAVFLHTSCSNERDPSNSAQTTVDLLKTSADTFDLIRAAKRDARNIFRDGFSYVKAGIIINDLVPARSAPGQLFEASDRNKSDQLMSVLDAVKGKFGRGALVKGAAGIIKEWPTKFDLRSPR